MNGTELSAICDEINGAGPDLDPLAAGAYAFGLLCDALREDYDAFIEDLVGPEPDYEKRSFRDEVVQEIERVREGVRGALESHAAGLVGDEAPPPVREVPRLKVEDLPSGGLASYEDRLVPLLFEGGVADCPAVRTWTPDYFKERYGGVVVPTNVYAGISRPIGEFIEELVETKGTKGGFITTNEDLFRAYPELVEQLEVDRTAGRLGLCDDNRNFSNHLFLSGRTGYCQWHSAGDTNLFYMIHGTKDWYLAHPKHTSWLHGTMCAGHMRGHFALSPVSPQKSFRREAEQPLANRIPLYHATIQPGDLLFVPPWWMHSVGNQTDIAIGVAARLTTPSLRNQSLGAGVLAAVERMFPGGTHLMDLANWRYVDAGANGPPGGGNDG